MITDVKKVTVKSLSALLKGITSNHKGYFYCLNCFIHSAQKENSKNMKTDAMIIIIVMQKYLMKTTKY